MKGSYFDDYVMIDIDSLPRRCPRPCHECGVLTKELMEQVSRVRGLPKVLHADRRTSFDQQDRRGTACRSRGHPVAFAAAGIECQPTLGIVVQDVEGRAGRCERF